MKQRFGKWALDVETRQLLADGEPRHLSPKAFELLGLMMRNRPRALHKSELHDELWPDTFVSEAALQTLVAEIRSVLGDDARRPRFVRTVRGYGYAFSAQVEPETPAIRADDDERVHRLYWREREVSLAPGRNVLGRTRESTIWIDSSSVSRRHACITFENGRATLEDLGSKNGTFLGNDRVVDPVVLTDGNVIQIGSVALTYRVYSGGDDTDTSPG